MPKRIESGPSGPTEQPPRDHMTSEIDQIIAGMRKLGEQEVRGIVDQGKMKVGIHMTKSNIIIWIGLHDLKADMRKKGLPDSTTSNINDFAWATAYTAWRTSKSVSVQDAYSEAPLYPEGAMPSRVIDPDANAVTDPLDRFKPKKHDRFDLI